MTVQEMIDVMTHFKNGGEIEVKHKNNSEDWGLTEEPIWNFNNYDYRKKESNTIKIEDLKCGMILIGKVSKVEFLITSINRKTNEVFLGEYSYNEEEINKFFTL